MKEMSEELRSLDDPGPGTRKIRARVNRVDAIISHRRKLSPTGICEQLRGRTRSLIQIAAARHDDQDIRRPVQNVPPRNADGIRAQASKIVLATRNLDHLRHPVPTAIHPVHPLHAEYSR